ncbi:MAG: NTP transferase domain-containing protein, partial [Nitrospinota bacterium]
MSLRVDTPAVVPAAGLGSRMRTLCGERPKELLPVGGRAAIEHSLLEALEAGLRRVAVVVRPDKPLIEPFLAGDRPATLGPWHYAGSPIDYRQRFEELLFVVQPQAVGVADAIARARAALRAEAVTCLMPDNVTVAPSPPIAA